MRITLDPGDTTVDTLITQPSRAFDNSSSGEPPLGIAGTMPPADGATPASRVMVIPEPPTAGWTGVTHGEPYFDTASGTVKVQLRNAGGSIASLNVLFWDPHTSIGPGQADTYQAGS